IFTGFLKDKDLIILYQNAKAFVFPSLYEGFGLPLLEAMSYRVPVICSATSSIPEIVSRAGYYFNPQSPIDMAQKIYDVLTKKDLQTKLIKEGMKRYKNFSWLKTAQETLRVYKSLIK
ncbi:MAG: glycosyltransferase, partial [Minisyncoccia bacterium]